MTISNDNQQSQSSSSSSQQSAPHQQPQTQQQTPPAQIVEQAIEQELRIEDVAPKTRWLSWSQASMHKLIAAESRLLSQVKAVIQASFVPVRLWSSKVYTITVKKDAQDEVNPVPFVLVHGFAAGVAVWKANLGALAAKRTVYAFDLLGFGRSSRPTFSSDPTLAELEYVQSIEDWRKAMNLDKMILVGHSFGAYLASSYALEHPSRVRHLVLVDPWGMSERPHTEQLQIPIWMRAVGRILSNFNPLAALRGFGPLGPILMQKLRSDLGARYSHDDPQAIYDYVYQCNAREPSGEMAFRTMTRQFGWPKRPMGRRFLGISTKVPVTFVCGSKSWVNVEPIYDIQSTRSTSYVDVQIVSGAGHHVYVDQPLKFNDSLAAISDLVDNDGDQQPIANQRSSSCS